MPDWDMLTPFDFFAEISPESKDTLWRNSKVGKFEKGQQLLQKGSRISGAYLLLEGRLRIYSIGGNGTEGTLYHLEPGNTCVFAMTCLFNDVLYPAWVESETPSKVAVINGPVFRKLFEAEPAIHRFTFDSLASLVFDLMLNLDRMMTTDLESRLAGLLLTRAASNGEVAMSHAQIASDLGTAREVVTRLLKAFRNRQWVETGRQRIKLMDINSIQKHLNDDLF